MTDRYPLTPSSVKLLVTAGALGAAAWLCVRFAFFGPASVDVSDFLIGFATSCAVGSLLVARFCRP